MTKFHKKLLWAGILVTVFVVFKLVLLYVSDTTGTVVCYFSSLYGVLDNFNLKTVALITIVYDMFLLWVTFLCYKRPDNTKFIGAISLYTGYLVCSGFYSIYTTITAVRLLISGSGDVKNTLIMCAVAVLYFLPVIAFVMTMLSQNEYIDYEEALKNGMLDDKKISDTEGEDI